MSRLNPRPPGGARRPDLKPARAALLAPDDYMAPAQIATRRLNPREEKAKEALARDHSIGAMKLIMSRTGLSHVTVLELAGLPVDATSATFKALERHYIESRRRTP